MRELILGLVLAFASLSGVLGIPQLQAATSSSSGSCAAAENTLTSTCGGVCSSNQTCLAYADNSSCTSVDCKPDATGTCEYECFSSDYKFNGAGEFFQFFVTFGSYVSAAEESARSSNPDFDAQVEALWDDTPYYSHASNNEVATIGELSLPQSTTTVYLCGGPTCSETVKGKVVLLDFDTFVAKESQINMVWLASIDLLSRIDSLHSVVPDSTLYLYLENCVITELPTSFDSITGLRYLWLPKNYIKVIDSTGGLDLLRLLDVSQNLLNTFDVNFPYLEGLNLSHNYLDEIPSGSLELDHLTALDVSDNLLTTLEGSLPSLQFLNLSANLFTDIPPIVFELGLTDFYFSGNSLSSMTFTSAQIAFLDQLNNTDIAQWTSVNGLNCSEDEQVTVKWVKLCKSDNVPTPEPTSKPKKLGLIIGIAAGGVVVVVAIIVVVCCCIRRKRNNQKSLQTDDGNEQQYYYNNPANNRNGYPPTAQSSDVRSSQVARQSDRRTDSGQRYDSQGRLVRESSSWSASTYGQEHHSSQALWNDPELLALQIRSEDIQDIRLLGTGAYGVVWLVRYRDSELMASKRLRREMVTRPRTQEFVKEIKLVSSFSHPNIVSFIGAAWHNDMDLQALFEFMENGDLRSFLVRPDVPRQWTPEKLQLAIDMVEAIVYVHSFSPPLVHRDLKSRNVLVSGEMRGKLTDFGVSRFQSNDSTMTMGVGTSRWLAPEIISGTTDYNQSADIFSIGVVLSELDTHELPYDDAVGPNGHKLEEVAILQRVASGALRPSFGVGCPRRILEIAHLCMSQEQADRPTAAEVAYVLRTFQRQMQQPQRS